MPMIIVCAIVFMFFSFEVLVKDSQPRGSRNSEKQTVTPEMLAAIEAMKRRQGQ